MIPFMILSGVVLLAVVLLCAVFVLRRKRALPVSVQQRLWKEWKSMMQLQDAQRKIMDAEKILDHALMQLGFTGSFGDKLKAAGPRFSRVQSVWDAHKLRNRLAHEVGVRLSDREASFALAAFEQGLKDLC